MNFELTEEQKLVQEMVRDFADNEILPKGKALEDQHEFPKEILKKRNTKFCEFSSDNHSELQLRWY